MKAPLLDEPRLSPSLNPPARVIGLATALPRLNVTQPDVLRFVLERFSVTPATQALYRRALSNKSILARSFALDSLDQVLAQDPADLNRRFEKEAVALSVTALTRALTAAGISATEVDFVAVATCTGYLCPGLASRLIEQLGMKPSTPYADIVGMGCGAALPTLQQAANFVKANPGATAAVVCTEICSAAMFSNDDADIVISNSIFADGSAAVILTSCENGASGSGDPASGQFLIRGFESLLIPEWRETLRFVNERGFLKNVLGPDVPRQAGIALSKLIGELLMQQETPMNAIDHWIVHPGGEKILNEVQAVLSLNRNQLEPSWSILRDHGNMSSATVLFALEETRTRKPQTGDLGVLCSFGAGFSAYAALIEFL